MTHICHYLLTVWLLWHLFVNTFNENASRRIRLERSCNNADNSLSTIYNESQKRRPNFDAQPVFILKCLSQSRAHVGCRHLRHQYHYWASVMCLQTDLRIPKKTPTPSTQPVRPAAIWEKKHREVSAAVPPDRAEQLFLPAARLQNLSHTRHHDLCLFFEMGLFVW